MKSTTLNLKDFPSESAIKNLQETRIRSLGLEDPLEEEIAATPLFLPGESHGQSSPVGYSLWGHKEWDMTE